MAYIGRTLSDFRYPTHMSYTDDTQPLLLKIWDWTVASHFGYGESLAFADIAPRDAITIFSISTLLRKPSSTTPISNTSKELLELTKMVAHPPLTTLSISIFVRVASAVCSVRGFH